MTTLVLSVTICIAVSALCSLLESVLYSTRLITLEAAPESQANAASVMKRFRSEIDRPLSAILILNTVANTAGAAVAGAAAAEVFGSHHLWVFSAAFTLAILILSEIIPKTVGAVYWRGMWAWSVYPLTGMIFLTSPFIAMTRWITGAITGKAGSRAPKVSEDEIVAAARLGAKDGEISRMEADIIRNILGLENLRAEDIMTPRTVMLAASGDRPTGEVAQEARAWNYSRVPVYRGGPEEIVGYVLKDSLLSLDSSEADKPLADMVKPVTFLPGSANALGLLNFFLRRREHLAMVVDEYGGIMGLVTLEDVIESLVGLEIVDETDQVADLQVLARRQGEEVLAQVQRTLFPGSEDDDNG